MKTLRLFGMALFAVLMCVNFASCSSDDVMENQEERKYTISLACVGEILDISQEPLTRGNRQNIYEIQIYANNTPYAYGKFTSVENLTVDLVSEKTYKFEVRYMINTTTEPTEKFDYTTTKGITDDYWGYGYYSTSEAYYGLYEDYTPSLNGSVNIYLKHMSFGLKVSASSLPTGTSILYNFKKDALDDITTRTPLEFDSDKLENNTIFTFTGDHSRIYKGKLVDDEYVDYYETALLQISFKRLDGIVVDLGTHEITVTRNKRTCVSITVGENASAISNGITITQENGTITDGDQYELDSDGTFAKI